MGRPACRRVRLPVAELARTAAVEYGPELLVDGDCEAADCSAWSSSGSPTLSKELEPRPNSAGTKSLRITSTGSLAYFYQSVLTKGRMYKISGWYKYSTVGRYIDATPGNGWALVNFNSTTGVWRYFEKIFFATGNLVRFYCPLNTAGSYSQFDELSIKEVKIKDLPGINTGANCYVSVPRLDGTIGMHAPGTARHAPLGAGVRNHLAKTNILTYSDLSQIGTLTALTLSRYEEQTFHKLLETTANSVHQTARTSAATLAASTTYTLSFCGRVNGARQVKVVVTTAKARDYSGTFDLTSENASYSFSFTTLADEAGACTVTVKLIKNASDSYAGETSCGMYLGQVFQLEAGNIPTPHVYTWNATASSVDTEIATLGLDGDFVTYKHQLLTWLSSQRFDFEVRIILNEIPTTGQFVFWWILWDVSGAESTLLWDADTGIFIHEGVSLSTVWAPEAGHTYKIRVIMESAGQTGQIIVVDETDNAIDVDETWVDRGWVANNPDEDAYSIYLFYNDDGDDVPDATIVQVGP